MSDSDLKIKFGDFTLHIGFKKTFAGNAYFNTRKNPSDEYIRVCEYINKHMKNPYYDQKGGAKRVWVRLNNDDITKLKNLGLEYNSSGFATSTMSLSDAETIAEEITNPGTYSEGATKKIFVNTYERSTSAREKCVAHYGYNCSVCEFNFGDTYGELGIDYIHVHHLKPLSEIRETYHLDPILDLRPVCPNCHSMLHRHSPALSIEALLKLTARQATSTQAKPA